MAFSHPGDDGPVIASRATEERFATRSSTCRHVFGGLSRTTLMCARAERAAAERPGLSSRPRRAVVNSSFDASTYLSRVGAASAVRRLQTG